MKYTKNRIQDLFHSNHQSTTGLNNDYLFDDGKKKDFFSGLKRSSKRAPNKQTNAAAVKWSNQPKTQTKNQNKPLFLTR